MQRLASSPEMAKLWLEHQRLRHEHPEDFGLKSTGIEALNHILGGGIELGQFVVVGGADKSGKTTLLLAIAKAFGKQNVNSLFLSAEMNILQMGTMMFASTSGISRGKIRSVGLEPDDWRILEDVSPKISKMKIWWSDTLSTMEHIKEVCNEVKHNTGEDVRAIFIDYIQLMQASKSKQNRTEEILYLSLQAKRLTLDRLLPTAVFAASQRNRESIKSGLVSSRDFLGGSLERDMDIGMIIDEEKDQNNPTGKSFPNMKRITIVGSRETDKGSCLVFHDGATALIEDTELVQLEADPFR